MSQPHVNMFGGSPLNRLAWLRSSQSFLNAIIISPASRWVLFNAGQPLVETNPNESGKLGLALLTTDDVRPLLGAEPFFGQGQNEGESMSPDGGSFAEAARHRQARIAFLGLQELGTSKSALPSSDFKDPTAAVANLEGNPFFSMDVADLGLPADKMDEILKKTTLRQKGLSLSWSEPRTLMTGLDRFTAAVFAEGRSVADWNQRNKFCPACGSPTYSMWGGWKLACSSFLPWADNTGRKPCPTAIGLHNFCHPRTDPVVIMLAIDSTGDRALLGRGKKFPGKFYSALAGFIEPGETFEDAVAREMWEEAGVRVWDIRYHSGQPWPYPSSLMVGFYTRADASKPIRTDLDNELADARWFSREEVLAVLKGSSSGFTAAENKKISDVIERRDNQNRSTEAAKSDVEGKPDEPAFRVPPATAIAGVLIRDWAEGKISFAKEGGNAILKEGSSASQSIFHAADMSSFE